MLGRAHSGIEIVLEQVTAHDRWGSAQDTLSFSRYDMANSSET